jgi:hypothetical protein
MSERSSPASGSTFIYALRCPITGRIRYVGKTNDPERRIYQHLGRDHANPAKAEWVNSLLAQGKEPTMVILEGVSRVGWKFSEHRWIRRLMAHGVPLFKHYPRKPRVKPVLPAYQSCYREKL